MKEDAEALAKSVGNAAGQQYERAQDLAKDTLHRSEGGEDRFSGPGEAQLNPDR
jgi:hypothetical protein